MKHLVLILVSLFTVFSATQKEEGTMEEFTLSSSAFKDGEVIPSKYTCEGDDISPPFEWATAPQGTKSFALTCVDPDAPMGDWIHWIGWNISATDSALSEGSNLPIEGTNSWGRTGYGGPCPPRGHGYHRYFFTLYALDVETLPLKSNARLKDLESAMEGHVLGKASLMGRYKRD